jgi:hypothetical protein
MENTEQLDRIDVQAVYDYVRGSRNDEFTSAGEPPLPPFTWLAA